METIQVRILKSADSVFFLSLFLKYVYNINKILPVKWGKGD